MTPRNPTPSRRRSNRRAGPNWPAIAGAGLGLFAVSFWAGLKLLPNSTSPSTLRVNAPMADPPASNRSPSFEVRELPGESAARPAPGATESRPADASAGSASSATVPLTPRRRRRAKPEPVAEPAPEANTPSGDAASSEAGTNPGATSTSDPNTPPAVRDPAPASQETTNRSNSAATEPTVAPEPRPEASPAPRVRRPARRRSRPTTPERVETRSTPAPPQNYRVQAGAFQNRENAQKMADRLASSGYQPSVTTAKKDGETMYHVQVGAFPNKKAADSAASSLKNEGVDAHVAGADE